ncbi:MAG: hypothetical protein NTW32_18615 [Chloroflexi bacterium]|nr:hypothetical protein [Chloroflexota bacterium]
MKLTTRQIGIALLAITTALLHIAAAFDTTLFPDGPDPLFILNAFGFIGLLGAYLLPIPFFQEKHKLVRWTLIGFAILTILAWVFIWVIQYVIIQGVPFFSRDSIYGVPAKIAEACLIYILLSDKSKA